MAATHKHQDIVLNLTDNQIKRIKHLRLEQLQTSLYEVSITSSLSRSLCSCLQALATVHRSLLFIF